MDLYSIAEKIGAKLHPAKASNVAVTGINTLEKAKSNQISFCVSSGVTEINTLAAACIARQPLTGITTLLSDNPYRDFAMLQQIFHPLPNVVGRNIHPTAQIDSSVKLPKDITIGAYSIIERDCLLGNGVSIGRHSIVDSSVHIGHNSRLLDQVTIHNDCLIGSACIISTGTVIGGEGFGFAPYGNGMWERVPQVGAVHIGDNVYFGNNCCIDRGTFDNTIIESNVILDNMVHIAHNVHIKTGCALAGQVGIAGSTTIGERCQFGGQVGITGHITLADDVICYGKSMVTGSIKKAGIYAGQPVQPVKEWRKNSVAQKRLYTLYTFFKKGNYENS